MKKLTKKEKEEMKELDKIWKDIDKGKCKICSVEELFKELEKN